MDYRGDRSFPAAWLDDLGYPQELRSLADSLLDLPGPSLAGDSPTGGGTLPVDLTDNWAQAPLRTTSSRSPHRVSRILGSLLGGAIGDALGAPIEFSNLRDIRKAHGPAGVTGYVPGHWGPGAFTDDTQMTLFTAEGLIRADNRRRERGLQDVPLVLWGAYRRWLETQELGRARKPTTHQSTGVGSWMSRLCAPSAHLAQRVTPLSAPAHQAPSRPHPTTARVAVE